MTKEGRARAGWLVGLLLCLPSSYVQGNAQTTLAAAQIPSFTVEHQRDVMVKVRDGVLLATDIYRPMENGKPVMTPLPVLLHRTPYDKSAAATIAIADTLASHGYVVVVQDTRGRHHSQGVFEKYYVFDAYDGFDTIEWAAKLPLAIAPVYEGYYLNEATQSDYDEHWQTLGMQWEKFYAQTADVPMLHIGGWYDIYLRGTIENYEKLSALKKSPMRLLIGPWTHHGDTFSYAGDVDFGPSAAIGDFDTDFHLRWFDFYLKGIQTSVAKEAPVRYFLMGTGDGHKDENGRLYHGGIWKDAQQWPPSAAHATNFYLHANGTLDEPPPTSTEAASTTFQFDPNHPVPTIGGGVSKRLNDGAYDQRERPDMPGSRPPYLPLRSRKDVLVFETAPLDHDVTIAGPVEVTLDASSTGTDMDFTAKLIDVYPPSLTFPRGFDMNLTDGILRASYRGDAKVRTLLHPGERATFHIRPYDTANVFKKGHRIRLDISSSNFPRFDINPNTGEPLGANRRTLVVDNTIYFNAPQPSQVKLSVLPAEVAP